MSTSASSVLIRKKGEGGATHMGEGRGRMSAVSSQTRKIESDKFLASMRSFLRSFVKYLDDALLLRHIENRATIIAETEDGAIASSTRGRNDLMTPTTASDNKGVDTNVTSMNVSEGVRRLLSSSPELYALFSDGAEVSGQEADEVSVTFPSSLSSLQRALIHRTSSQFGLLHSSTGGGQSIENTTASVSAPASSVADFNTPTGGQSIGNTTESVSSPASSVADVNTPLRRITVTYCTSEERGRNISEHIRSNALAAATYAANDVVSPFLSRLP